MEEPESPTSLVTIRASSCLLLRSLKFRISIKKNPPRRSRNQRVSTRTSPKRNMKVWSNRWRRRKPQIRPTKSREGRTLTTLSPNNARSNQKSRKKNHRNRRWRPIKNLGTKLNLKFSNGSKRESNKSFSCLTKESIGSRPLKKLRSNYKKLTNS